MQGRLISLPRRFIDLLQRHAMNAVFAEKPLSGDDQPLARVTTPCRLFILHVFHTNAGH